MCVFLLLSVQGEKADCFYIVESGEVKIMIKSKVSTLCNIISESNCFFRIVNITLVLKNVLVFDMSSIEHIMYCCVG